ncbi:unnamed protein product, partial [Discosporangium mesarthrocarpum]
GPVISAAARDHIVSHVTQEGAKGWEVLLDGRLWATRSPGTWVGPTIIRAGPGAGLEGLGEEVFGPLLKVVQVRASKL